MRSTALRLAAAAAAAFAVVPAIASHATAPVLDQQCSTNKDIAQVNVAMKAGHAAAGNWTLKPIFACKDAEIGLTVHAVINRNGRAFLTSDGRCTSTIPSCTTATGTVKRAQLGASIRGTYVLVVTATITGVDAALTQDCDYSAVTLTATCTATSSPVVIR